MSRVIAPEPRFPWRRMLGVLMVGSLVVAASAFGVGWSVGGLSSGVEADLDRPVELTPLAARSFIYDSAGKQMAVLFASEDREEVKLSAVPKSLQRAVVGIEDRDFFQHGGFSIRSTFRALSQNLESGAVEQGGSTITQQLVKNSILGSEQTFARKLNEAVLSLRLEDQMSKRQILERYLNTVYLGHGAYGVQAGAETYFNRSVEDIGWPEAAMLTALIRNPVGYDPVAYPTLARQRRALVARRLHELGIINSVQVDAINEAPLPTQVYRKKSAGNDVQLAGANYFSEAVKQQLLDLPVLGATSKERFDKVFGGGLRIETTYDEKTQEQAEAAVAELPDTDGKFAAALASVESRTGAVRALVGGSDFSEQQFNYATQGWRQPGSSFKFFVLMAAFQYAALIPDDTVSGVSPCRFPDAASEGGVYKASNSHGGGSIASIDRQTLSSSNCAFLRLGQVVGLDKVAALANAMGITTLSRQSDGSGSSELVEGPVPSNVISLPLGTQVVHPLQMAAAYATAANDGVYHAPYLIERITDASGKVIYQHSDPGTQVVSEQTARLVTEVLAHNVTSGTGRKAQLEDQPAAGKTGTTNDNADVWFVGYTPYLSTAVWLGSPTKVEKIVIKGKTQYGADYPAKIWNAFMEAYHQDLPVVEFPTPDETRRAKSVKYSNKLDSGRPVATTTTTTPGAGAPAAPAGD